MNDNNSEAGKELERRIQEWKDKGKKPEEITWGMLCDGFQSIAGLPDDFYSAEDPADRVRLWKDYQAQQQRSNGCDCGWCSSCDPTYKD
ncbi:hypothetical protein HY642_03440 [Candidatus Woesearchaeota archaeon]|nr:hypothetical protein [Candidatus Woesearchaeota archaeon]